jgi:hypothetical protein
MFHTIVLWFVVINIFMFLWNRKRYLSLGNKGLKLLRKYLIIFFKNLKSFLWFLLKKLGWFIPRFLHWLGWLILEFGKFIYNALKALFTILKS